MTAPPAVAALSPAEQSMWLLHQLAPDRGLANVAVYVEAPQPVRWWPMREAFRWLVARHPALRSSFPIVDSAPTKVVSAADDVEAEIALFHVDVDGADVAQRDFAGQPFDVARPPLVRLGVFHVDGAPTRLCLVVHHLLADAASLEVLLAELRAGYAGLTATDEPPDLPPPPPPVPPRPSAESLRYWRDRLAGLDPSGARLAVARVSGAPTFAAAEIERAYPPSLTAAVASLRRSCRGTEPAVLLAAYRLALRAQGAADDCVVGVMVSNRPGGIARGVGYHVSALPLRLTVDPESTFADLVAATAGELLTGVEYADVSFELLAPELVSPTDDPLWWRTGLVRHMFNYRTPPEAANDGEPVRDVATGVSRFELELTVQRALGVPPPGAEPGSGWLIARLAYSTDAHDRAFAEGLLDRIGLAVAQAVDHPDRPVGDFDLRTAAEAALLASVNATAVDWAPPLTVPELILRAARTTPDAPAVVDADRTLCYRELLEVAADVAALLRGRGVGAGDVVGLASPRGAGLAAAVLGTWAVGAAYLPLDAEHPPGRLRHQLDDSGCTTVLDGQLLPPPCRDGLTCIPVPDAGARRGGAPELPPRIAPDALAYLIYTSGSTGRPKGVRLTHGNLANVVRHFAGELGTGGATAVLWLTTFAFDISALELFLPLIGGGRVVTAPDRVRGAPEELLDLVVAASVTVVQATPTTWRMVLPAAGRRLAGRTVLCGGEPMPAALARQFRAAGCRAYNVYGPTETTIWSTSAELDDGDRVTVGRPIANTGIHLLDDRRRPVAPGVIGELWLSGAGVADGYHGQPELTAERFVTDPVTGRRYRTGDYGRLLPDGRLELRGRRDRQVKLRAHRIELTEVEDALADHPEVRAAGVALHGDPSGPDGCLVGYVAAADRPGLAADVWAFAGARLPAYSLPSRIVVLPRLPQTPNGKVDTGALAAEGPEPSGPDGGAGTGTIGPAWGGAAGGPAADPVEQALVRVWAEVLRRPRVDRDSNFFLLGGTSLMAVRAAELASEHCARPVTMAMVFRAPTPAALAARIRADRTDP